MNSTSPIDSVAPPKHKAFASLASRDFRVYFASATAAMLADNIEHVISYWVMYQKFHSPALAGFAVISHWVPFLLLGGFTGLLADRFDIRRLIQVGMVLYMAVSLSWGLMFVTDTVTMGRAMTLLVIHGLAGVIWSPASQVLIHQIVTPAQLPSAVRLSATGRTLATLVGPAVGAGLLLSLGPAWGIWVNAAIYLPLAVWLIRAPYGRAAVATGPARQSLKGFSDVWAAIKVVRQNRVLLSMTVLIGAAAFFIGNSYQAQMPGFADDLGHGRTDFSYSVLLGADAAGGLLGGIILESRGLLPPRARTAFILAMFWCCALFGFARSHTYALSISLLFIAGFTELAFNSMAQTLVQINAPGDMRGRVLGVFAMSAMGLRAFAGLNVGLLGASIGIHNSMAISAAALFVLYAIMFGARQFRPSVHRRAEDI